MSQSTPGDPDRRVALAAHRTAATFSARCRKRGMALKIRENRAVATEPEGRVALVRGERASRVASIAEPVATRLSTNGLVEVHADSQFRVLTDVALRPRTVSTLVDHVRRASRFNLAHSKKPIAFSKPVNVQVLSDKKFFETTKSRARDIVGWTLDADNFLIPARAAKRLGASSDDTVAHELGHVRDYRELGAFRQKVPAVFQEGVNYVLGDMYGKTVAKHPTYLRDVARAITGLKAQTARYNLDHFLVDADYDKPACAAGEFVGAAFIEYLRVHVDKEVVAKRAPLFVAVGQGQSFKAAFAAQFGVSLFKAQNDFVSFIKATEKDSQARLAATIWAER